MATWSLGWSWQWVDTSQSGKNMLITKMLIYNSAISTDLCLAPIWLKPSHLIFLITVPKKLLGPFSFHSWKYGFAFGKRFLAGCIECTFAVQTVVLPRLNSSFCSRFHSVQLLYVFGNTDHKRMWLELGAETKQPYMMQLTAICTRSYSWWRPIGLHTFSFDIED